MTDVVVLLGSASDSKIAAQVSKILDRFGIGYKVTVASAHRTPQKVRELIESAHNDGVKVFIAIAGLAAHLPGFIASQTTRPVIGVPVNAALNGMDALLSIVQMPGGIPVACVGIGRGDNAALLAAQMMALENKELKEELDRYREELTDSKTLFE